jgi:hypothetical protein
MIDHLFMFVEADGPEIAHLGSLGLIETYRRTHSGQGTQNVCYCFDNLYLELLWVNDADAVRNDGIKRTGLYERSLWRVNGNCPFGIALRRSPVDPVSLFSTWEFKPPYLPQGVAIAVATDSDDPAQPMIFLSPGSTPPLEWPADRRGSLQHSLGLGAVTEVTLTMPKHVTLGDALKTAVRSQFPPLRIDTATDYSLHLEIASLLDKPDFEITLPLSTNSSRRQWTI